MSPLLCCLLFVGSALGQTNPWEQRQMDEVPQIPCDEGMKNGQEKKSGNELYACHIGNDNKGELSLVGCVSDEGTSVRFGGFVDEANGTFYCQSRFTDTGPEIYTFTDPLDHENNFVDCKNRTNEEVFKAIDGKYEYTCGSDGKGTTTACITPKGDKIAVGGVKTNTEVVHGYSAYKCEKKNHRALLTTTTDEPINEELDADSPIPCDANMKVGDIKATAKELFSCVLGDDNTTHLSIVGCVLEEGTRLRFGEFIDKVDETIRCVSMPSHGVMSSFPMKIALDHDTNFVDCEKRKPGEVFKAIDGKYEYTCGNDGKGTTTACFTPKDEKIQVGGVKTNTEVVHGYSAYKCEKKNHRALLTTTSDEPINEELDGDLTPCDADMKAGQTKKSGKDLYACLNGHDNKLYLTLIGCVSDRGTPVRFGEFLDEMDKTFVCMAMSSVIGVKGQSHTVPIDSDDNYVKCDNRTKIFKAIDGKYEYTCGDDGKGHTSACFTPTGVRIEVGKSATERNFIYSCDKKNYRAQLYATLEKPLDNDGSMIPCGEGMKEGETSVLSRGSDNGIFVCIQSYLSHVGCVSDLGTHVLFGQFVDEGNVTVVCDEQLGLVEIPIDHDSNVVRCENRKNGENFTSIDGQYEYTCGNDGKGETTACFTHTGERIPVGQSKNYTYFAFRCVKKNHRAVLIYDQVEVNEGSSAHCDNGIEVGDFMVSRDMLLECVLGKDGQPTFSFAGCATKEGRPVRFGQSVDEGNTTSVCMSSEGGAPPRLSSMSLDDETNYVDCTKRGNGDKFESLDGKYKYKCGADGKGKTIECLTPKRDWIPVGVEKNINGINFKCEQKNHRAVLISTVQPKEKGVSCSYNGQLHKITDTWEVNGGKFVLYCQKDWISVLHCQTPYGEPIAIDGEVTMGAWTYKCHRKNDNITIQYSREANKA